MRESYQTLSSSAEAEFLERKSRFIGLAAPIRCEQEALDIIASVRSKHYNATHNVYAYILQENNVMRYSDDGEPQGTAGVPVLEVLRKEGVTDCVVVVTRYFGGILLGAGGLVRAYGKSAKLALDAAGITTRSLCQVFTVTTDYGMSGKVQYAIGEGGYHQLSADYRESVQFTVAVELNLADHFQAELTECTFGQASIRPTEQRYFDFPVKQ